MKAISLAMMCVFPLALFAGEVKPGDTAEGVQATLGIPRGRAQIGGREFFYYDRGEVEMRSGVVTRVALISIEDQAALEARRSADALRVREEQEILRARLTTEGEALKARKLSDPYFLAASPARQVEFWEDFSRRYPGVPSAEELGGARARLAEQVAERRELAAQSLRLADLEARLAEAESRTAETNGRMIFARGYDSSYFGQRDYHPFSLGPIRYRFYESPLPYATSPGLPPIEPKYRDDPMSFSKYLNEDDDFSRDHRHARGHSGGNRRDYRRSASDFSRY